MENIISIIYEILAPCEAYYGFRLSNALQLHARCTNFTRPMYKHYMPDV